MLARLGNALFWLSGTIAAVILLFDAYMWVEEGERRSNEIGLFVFIAVIALIVWLIGLACRYVLSGRSVFGWIKKRRAFRLGQQAAVAITDEIEERIAGRVMTASERFMNVLKQRLATLWDDASEDPRAALRVERDEFEKNLSEFLGEMRAEINIKTYRWGEIIDSGGETLDQYIHKRLTAVKNTMMQQAAKMIAEATAEIERREKQPTVRQNNALDGQAKEVMRIKMICQVAHGSAQTVREAKDDPEWIDHERKRYEKHRTMALDAAKVITDEFYRDAAVHSIIELCIMAGDRDAARALFRSVRTDMIRDKVLGAHPALR